MNYSAVTFLLGIIDSDSLQQKPQVGCTTLEAKARSRRILLRLASGTVESADRYILRVREPVEARGWEQVHARLTLETKTHDDPMKGSSQPNS